ncbi:hypothetical protein B0H13DRAFT_2415100 [Mycena leptocephala]|nr:hypothetical protein B0H13DRAFT_2415100 [Mycena leptocephala]
MLKEMGPLARNATMKPRLPPELVDQVIRNLHYSVDKRTLSHCGLVSRTWLALSRAVLFYSIFITPFSITPNNKKALTAFKYPAIRPHVREIVLFVDPTAKWTETQLPKLLAQFPACKGLRLAGNWNLLPRLHMTPELELSPTARDLGIVTLLRGFFTFPSFARRNSTMAVESNEAEDPTVVRTVHLDFPLLNSPVLALLAPPADTLHIMLQDSDPEAVHGALRAAGAGLRALVLRSRTNLLIGRPATPLTSQLWVLYLRGPVSCSALMALATHLLEYVLAVPSLEELAIETQEFDIDKPTNCPSAEARQKKGCVWVCELVHNVQTTWAAATTRAGRGNDGGRAIRGEIIVYEQLIGYRIYTK